ncbi:proteasome accessory factor B [Hamadaea flava]|uniref:Helix-turn-helix transcriptional regulator n=1 Tax=Hamadaea flava TaxID=1742688 RepID=A0ABV8LTM2_9ACTN|nr:WYL domain-containing protein [Hamadaea flava]MCP2328316.1 proteasome accessory factor B [Hamadaea flava]
MNRTERLYALVDELRAAAPRARTVPWLANRFEVSHRTIQRDLQSLMQAGLPVRAQAGRAGDWWIDPSATLPPINLTPEEAVAIAVALAGAEETTPFVAAGADAMRKLAAALTAPAASRVRELTSRVIVLPSRTPADVVSAVETAVANRTLLRLTYVDSTGAETDREVEPHSLLAAAGHWYLIGWCRTRDGGRGFRLDRIRAAEPTTERTPLRELGRLDGRLGTEARRARSLLSFLES